MSDEFVVDAELQGGPVSAGSSADGVAFLIAEFNNQYEQFRHQDHLRVSYLQIYFSLATVVLAGTGLVLSATNFPLLLLVSVGYLFLFYVGQLATKMMGALRAVQLRTAVLLDLIRTYLGRQLDVLPALINPGGMKDHPFYEDQASSTWVLKFVSVLNGFFLACFFAFAAAAAVTAAGVTIAGAAIAVVAVLGVAAVAALVAGTVRRNQARLRDDLLRVRDGLDLESLYARFDADGGSPVG